MFITGCASFSPYGNYVEQDSPTYNQVIAGDLVGQLTHLYPPANTRFNLQHSSEDAFGAALIQTYALAVMPLKISRWRIGETGIEKTANTPKEGTTLAYILDETSDVYRLSVMVNDQILTRAYRPYKESIYPAGSWARKE